MEGGEWGMEQVKALVRICGAIFNEVRARKGRYDWQMLWSYLKWKGLDKVDVCFAFYEGN